MSGLGSIPTKGDDTYVPDLGRLDRRWLVGLLKDGKLSGGVEEAPLDGVLYGRQDGDWFPIVLDDQGNATLQTSGTLPLDNQTKDLMPPGLKMQSDANKFIAETLDNNSQAIVNNAHLISQLNETVSSQPGFDDLPDLSGYATVVWVKDQKYLTSDDIPEVNLDGYATEDWVKGQGYASTTEVNQKDTAVKDELGLKISANESLIKGNTAEIQKCATKEELQAEHNAWTLADDSIQKAYLKSDEALAKGIEANTAAIAAIDTSGDGPDLSAYALKTEIPTDNATLANGAGYITSQDLPVQGPDVDLRETVYSAARVSHLETLVWAGQNQAPPSPDPSGSIGWHYTSAGDGTKAYWTLWSQDRDSHTKLTLAEVYSYSLLLSGKGTAPYLQVLTKRKGDGNDAASTYRSKLAFQLSGELPPALANLTLLTTAESVPLYANLAHLLMARDDVGTKGPCEDDEEISKVVLSTNSVAKEGEFDFMLSSLVLHTKQGTYDTHLEFTGLTEVPEAPDVDLDGYATTTALDAETQARKDGDTACSYQLQQAEKGLEAKIDANTAAIAAIEIPEAGGGADPSLPYALVTRETDSNTLPPKPKSASDGVATTQILETITLQDASGNSLGDVHFESGFGIGVAMSTRHPNTIYIQGGSLQNDIKDNGDKIEALEAQVKSLEDAPPPQAVIDWDSLPELN